MRWLVRLVLLRILPRKLLPILTVWEVWKIVRGQQLAARERAKRGSAAKPPTPGPATRRPATR